MTNLQRSFSLLAAVSAMICATPALAQNTTSLSHTVVLEDLENPLDMAFLDGDHTIRGCLKDWNAVQPALKPGGIVASAVPNVGGFTARRS